MTAEGWTGKRWVELGLVFTTEVGTPLDAANVRRDFRIAIEDADGIEAKDWTPRELRHSFVSLLSDQGVPVEEISRLVGHKNTNTTELIYRKQIRPVIQAGATAMDALFTEGCTSECHPDKETEDGNEGQDPGDLG